MFVIKSRKLHSFHPVSKLTSSPGQDVGYVHHPFPLSITAHVTGNPANPELIQIPAGQLYLVRPNSIKGSRECM